MQLSKVKESNTTARFKLEEDQVAALNFCKANHKVSVLTGSAGVGKTTVIQEYANTVDDILLTAPTHKAAKVLRQKTHVECSTIQSFLKLKRKFNYKKKKYEFIFDPSNFFNSKGELQRWVQLPKVLVVDESSMLDTHLIQCILRVCDTIKVIFVGDDKQLNPIDPHNVDGLNLDLPEICSPIFHLELPTYELTKIIRQADGNDIVDLSRNLDWLYDKIDGENFKWCQDMPIDLLVEANGTDSAKFITWTNKTVHTVNKFVRECLYGKDPDQFKEDETILLTEQFKDIYFNNQEIKITSVQDTTHYYTTSVIPNPHIETFTLNGNLEIVRDDFQTKHKQNIAYLTECAKSKLVSWKAMYDYQELFGKYQYNSAITVHRSQGSTYGTSLINITEIMRNKKEEERSRMLYTAITRAKNFNFLT